jgi:bifunctional DNA-binding transcriptional regulator/antitoxin component of YhaV-PrlF toxin-antitoxin module
MLTTLSPDLTTQLPAELARQFGLSAGSQLDWVAGSDANVIMVTVLHPGRKELLERVRAIGSRHRKSGEDSVADLIAERTQDDQRRAKVLP